MLVSLTSMEERKLMLAKVPVLGPDLLLNSQYYPDLKGRENFYDLYQYQENVHL